VPTGSGWRWQRLREQVLARDGGRCQLCGQPAQQVDHIVPRADGGSDALDNLRAVCGRCHRVVTRNWRRRRVI
jgi:5-methylcytosine-specific restriction protein A